jgi:hypothetical protein
MATREKRTAEQIRSEQQFEADRRDIRRAQELETAARARRERWSYASKRAAREAVAR